VIQLDCPHCGLRDADEFRYVGERHARPDPATATPTAWRAYLYLRDNPAGWAAETWLHRAGCRRFLAVERHTVTNEVRSIRDAAAGGRGTAVDQVAPSADVTAGSDADPASGGAA
jgi:heterotetrameric sarcosine oxidase delta subunit